MMPACGINVEALSEHMAVQVLEACPDRHRSEVVTAVQNLFEELRPTSALEAMLVAQMVGCHFISMNEMKNATSHRVSDQSQHTHLQMALKLQRTFVSQVEALLKVRGSNSKRMPVDH